MNTLQKAEFIIVQIEKNEILTNDYHTIDTLLKNTLEKDHTKYFQSVHLIFDGFNDNPKEIYEIPEIRNWVKGMVMKLPQIFFFLEQENDGFQNVVLCIGDVKVKRQVGIQKQLDVHIPTSIYDEVTMGLYEYEKNIRAFYLLERVLKNLANFRY